MIWVRGVEYGTAAQLAARLRVTPDAVYKWRDRDQLTTVRIAGRVYSPVCEATRIEHAKRHAARGRPRQLDMAGAAA